MFRLDLAVGAGVGGRRIIVFHLEPRIGVPDLRRFGRLCEAEPVVVTDIGMIAVCGATQNCIDLMDSGHLFAELRCGGCVSAPATGGGRRGLNRSDQLPIRRVQTDLHIGIRSASARMGAVANRHRVGSDLTEVHVVVAQPGAVKRIGNLFAAIDIRGVFRLDLAVGAGAGGRRIIVFHLEPRIGVPDHFQIIYGSGECCSRRSDLIGSDLLRIQQFLGLPQFFHHSLD